MDSSPASQAAGSNAAADERLTPTNETASQSQAVTTGFSLSDLELAAAMLETVNHCISLEHEVKQIIHVPKARERITVGFELLAHMQGGIFGILADQRNYNKEAFYNAADDYRKQQRAIAQRTEIARLAGMTLEEFDAKLKENETKPTANSSPTT